MRRALAAALAALAVAAAGASDRLADHVVLISVDGLVPECVARAQELGLPHLQALRDAGSWAEGVVGVYPSVTYPAHSTMVTGVRPARHGITYNTYFEPATGSPRWRIEAAELRAPTLWDLARAKGLLTAGVSWPVTVGARIDALIPETDQPVEEIRRLSTPGLVDEVLAGLPDFGPLDMKKPAKRDAYIAAATCHIIKTKRPHLVMVHLVETDSAQHAFGRGSPQARQAFKNADARIGEIVAAVEQAGIRERTAFVVTGDHGFFRVHSALQPNVVLRQAGLLETDTSGRIVRWQAAGHRAFIRVADPKDQALRGRVESLFRGLAEGQYRGLFRVLDRSELDALGAYPEALLAIEPVEGYTVTDGFVGDAFVAPATTRGQHGYLPTNPGMYTGLVLSGAGIRRGLEIPLARQVDIAPTVARLLGLSMTGTDGVVMVGILQTGAMP